MATKQPTNRKQLSRAEREKIDADLFRTEGISGIVTEMDGVEYKVTTQGLVPLTGSKAQQIIRRKPKTKK